MNSKVAFCQKCKKLIVFKTKEEYCKRTILSVTFKYLNTVAYCPKCNFHVEVEEIKNKNKKEMIERYREEAANER